MISPTTSDRNSQLCKLHAKTKGKQARYVMFVTTGLTVHLTLMHTITMIHTKQSTILGILFSPPIS